MTFQWSVRASAALVRFEPGTRRFCVSVSASAHVVVDVQAALAPDTDALRLTGAIAPQRLFDSRVEGRRRVTEIDPPGHSAMVALNLTATGSPTAGFLTAYPCGPSEPPRVSNVNFAAGETVAGMALVPTGDSGEVCIAASTGVDVVVDLLAEFDTSGGYGFVPVTPTRMLDTRDGTGGWVGPHGAGQTIDVRVAPGDSVAVAGTVTVVHPVDASFATVGPAGSPVPPTSNVNASRGGLVVANAFVAASATGSVGVSVRAAGHSLVDVTGWWVGVD